MRPRLTRLAPLVAALAMTVSSSLPLQAGEFKLPDGPGRALVYAKCRTCHDLQYVIESKGMTADAWDGLLSDMEGFGVELTSDEYDRILTYMSTYMSDKPAPAAPATDATVETVDGGSVFAENCTSCHQEDAQGIEETFPPLAQNNDLFLSTYFPARVLINGMSGAITVNGKPFEGEMPSFAHLSDAEIAAVVNYLRDNFGNHASAHPNIDQLKPETVADIRQTEMSPQQILALRNSLKDK